MSQGGMSLRTSLFFINDVLTFGAPAAAAGGSAGHLSLVVYGGGTRSHAAFGSASFMASRSRSFGRDAGGSRMGTAILRHAERGPCHFRPYYAVSLLVRPGLKLPSQVRQTIERYVRASLPRAMAPDLRFHGFNDNFPAMATALLALADSYFTIKAARDMRYITFLR